MATQNNHIDHGRREEEIEDGGIRYEEKGEGGFEGISLSINGETKYFDFKVSHAVALFNYKRICNYISDFLGYLADFLNMLLREKQRNCNGWGGVQRPDFRVKEPKSVAKTHLLSYK